VLLEFNLNSVTLSNMKPLRLWCQTTRRPITLLLLLLLLFSAIEFSLGGSSPYISNK